MYRTRRNNPISIIRNPGFYYARYKIAFGHAKCKALKIRFGFEVLH
jgi:hypothetical protein